MIKAETDWRRLNRAVGQMTTRLAAAQFEEGFQSIGHLAREAFISLGQAVYDPARHPSEDGITPSATDATRMLTAYVAAELSGAGNEEARRFARLLSKQWDSDALERELKPVLRDVSPSPKPRGCRREWSPW
jgi:hypothetical protein